MNFKPGKTEGMTYFMGKEAALYKRKVCANDGCIDVCVGVRLRVVDKYVHLGTTLASDLNVQADVPRRTSSAMTAYGCMARVFGLPGLAKTTRVDLAKSLVGCRLVYNVATWPRITAWAFRQLNSVYMRPIRRVAGKPRYCKTWRDEQVCHHLGVPSLDCVLRQRRLLHLL